MKSNNFLPDFLCIGTQRSGTTWLFENIRQHPQIYLPYKKELNFFSEINGNYAKGIEWYKNFFKDAPPQAVKGEITPEYLLDPKSSLKIFDSIGPIKIIAILRNPLDRAFSSYGKGLREGDWDVGFNEFIKSNMDYCIDRGQYHRHLKPYIEIFGQKNILIKIYEDIKIDPYAFLKEVYTFLNVDPEFMSTQVNNKFNIGVSNRGLLLKFVTAVRDNIYNSPFNASIKWLQRHKIINSLMSKLMTSNKKLKNDPDWLKEKFYVDSKKLSNLINRDMIHEWNLSKNE